MSDPSTARRPGGPGNRWELIWSHRDELLEIAHSRSSSAEEAEDAVQEAMIRAVENPDVHYGRVRSWLRTATVRACAERHRQVARDRELSRSLSAAPVEPFPVEERACDRAEAEWLADRSAELLPARQAHALRLQAQDLDVGQVARTMGLSYRATESLLARARRSLRDVLAGSLTLAATVWMCARRFPRTGVTQSAGVTSAAVTLAVAGLVLPAGPFDRPDGRSPGDGPETVAPRAAPAAEIPAPRAAPARPPAATPSPVPRRVDRARQDTSRPVPRVPPSTDGQLDTVAVEISIGSGRAAPALPSVAASTSIPALPVDASDVRRREAHSAPSAVTTVGVDGTVDLPDGLTHG
ncbi:RNA polymerase sigma factor [Streptomyces sp. HB132]|uniref:RNA polymerase sigma factor n=1 Tax=Streptomyces sp. HB132 TaxID=767388 RepID=UPI0019600244|nr:sigma-70 family RNA polymerase sigma factor [Streptomyces sp. HB132]MBM7441922.1 RNA polymerase sigma factor (sigma-70 family) [Streptomyces sp. HB132]